MVFILIKPCTPCVDGITQPIHFQKSGTAASGHDTPDMKSIGTDVNTNTSIGDSRPFITVERNMAKNIDAVRKGSRNNTLVHAKPIFGMEKMDGTASTIYIVTTTYIIK